MFKWYGWCLLFILLLLVSCDPMTPPVVVEEKPVSDDGTYYFLAANNADPFYVPGVQGFNDAGELVGVKTEFVGPMDMNVNEQLKTFEELVANPNTGGIFWYPTDFAIGETVIKDALQKDIPVFDDIGPVVELPRAVKAVCVDDNQEYKEGNTRKRILSSVGKPPPYIQIESVVSSYHRHVFCYCRLIPG